MGSFAKRWPNWDLRDIRPGNAWRRIAPEEQPDNRYHANIVLPSVAAGDREVQRVHAQKLADGSTWRERP